MYLTKQIKKLTKLQLSKRDIKFFFQRLFRGWDDGDTFSLDHSLAKLIAPRLKRFKEVSIAVPYGVEEKEWAEMLDTMIASFEYFGSETRWLNPQEEIKHQKGIDLFSKYYTSLWW